MTEAPTAIPLSVLIRTKNEADRLGWVGKGGFQAEGASGAPLWYDDGDGPKVVGVAGHAQSILGTSRPIGSKITPGARGNMIENYIRKHR